MKPATMRPLFLRLRPLVLLAASAVAAGIASNASADHHADEAVVEAGEHAALRAYDGLLSRHVDEAGLVDYAALSSDAAAGPALTGVLSLAAEADLARMPTDERLALLINVYNAAVLDVLLAHGAGTPGGVKSILDIEGGKVFATPRVELGGSTASLNQLEKDRIRPLAGDARYHFAVNCGAWSCPPLRSAAYTAAGVQDELDEQRALALTTDAPRFLRWSAGGAVEATKLMDWYGEEFGDPAAYLNEHADLPGAVTSVSFLEYDWKLNAR